MILLWANLCPLCKFVSLVQRAIFTPQVLYGLIPTHFQISDFLLLWERFFWLFFFCPVSLKVRLSEHLYGSAVINPSAMQEVQFWSLGWEDPLEKEMASHSSILAWRIPWTELPVVVTKRVGQDLVPKNNKFLFYSNFKSML